MNWIALVDANMGSMLIVVVGATTWVVMMLAATVGIQQAAGRRYDYVVQVLPADALNLYFAQWFPGDSSADKATRFRELYRQRYLRRHHVWSVAFLVVLAAIMTFLCHTARHWLVEPPGRNIEVLCSALAGGVTWVLLDQLTRMRRRDYTADDVGAQVFRLVISGPLGLALSAVLAASLGATTAFLLGTFPTQSLIKYGRRIVDRRFQLGDEASSVAPYALEALQGITRAQAERFEEEGVQSILQLAYSDPIDLTIRTNYHLDFVTDCVSQALLWTYAKGQFDHVQGLGLRGAVEAANLHVELRSVDPEVVAAAQATLELFAQVMKITPPVAFRMLEEVGRDPYTEFIVRLWGLKTDAAA